MAPGPGNRDDIIVGVEVDRLLGPGRLQLPDHVVARIGVLRLREALSQELVRDLQSLGRQSDLFQLPGEVACYGLIVLTGRVYGLESNQALEASEEDGGASIDKGVEPVHQASIANPAADGKPGMACKRRRTCISRCP